MATVAALMQLSARPSLGTDAIMDVWYMVVDSTAQTSEGRVAVEVAFPAAAPATWKDVAVQAIINDAALGGYTLTAANVRWLTYEPGDYRVTEMAAGWTKDITKTNLTTTRTNVYIGNAGEGQLVDFQSFRQYRLVIGANKVGIGNLTHGLYEVGTETNNVEMTYTGVAGEFTHDSGWLNLPAWATGERILKPMTLTSNTGDDPIYRTICLYLR